MHKLFQVHFSPITPGYGLFELLPCNIFAKTAIRYIQGLPEARLLKSVVEKFLECVLDVDSAGREPQKQAAKNYHHDQPRDPA